MRLLLIVLFIFATLPAAYAEEPANPVSIGQRGTWYISWSGIPFAKLWIALEESADDYRLTASYKSRGIMRIFDKTKSLALSHGARNGDRMQALDYSYEDSVKESRIVLEFDRAGELVRREAKPDDDPAHRPPVTAEAIKGAITPGDMLFAIRQSVRKAQAEGSKSFTHHFYEGRRLMQIDAMIADSPEPYEIKGKDYSVIRLELSRQLLGGFTNKEIKRYKKGEPPALLYLDADTLFPLALEIEVKYGTLKAEWIAE